MRLVACLLLLTAAAAHAQMYKCTEGGKTRYSDKPIPDCKDARSMAAPTSAAPTSAAPTTKTTEPARAAAQPAKPAAKPAAPQTSRAALTPEERAQENKHWQSRCQTLREEEQWLQSPRGQKIENHAARLGQGRQALGSCR